MSEDLLYGIDLAKYKIARSKEELENANILFEKDRWKASNNRAYYSAYYAMTAVLSIEGVAFTKHKDTIAYFNKNYVNKGLFPKEIGRKIHLLEEIRHKSDYDDFYVASKVIAEQQILISQELIELVEDYIMRLES